MKKLLLLCSLLLSTTTLLLAQKVIDEKISLKGGETLMKFSFADGITLEAWDKGYIGLHVEVNIQGNEYNDYYSLDINKNGGNISIVENIDFKAIKKLRGNIAIQNFDTEINYSLKVPEKLKVNLETISGEIELIGCQGEMSVKSVSGFIDYSIPRNHKANIELATVTGDVYSNVKFDGAHPDEISWVGTKRELLLNGGNTEVGLKTVSGDIFLREY